jgi:hypothetical protein
MRKETSDLSVEADALTESSPAPGGGGAVDLADAGLTGPAPAPVGRKAAKLTALLALAEPARTEALEKIVNSGVTVNLRSKTGEEVRWRYGEHILVVPPTPKPFAAAHAIHLLFCAPDLVEEVEE